MQSYFSVEDMVKAMGEPEFARQMSETTAARQLTKLLSILRNKAGLTQAQVAARMGCTQSRIAKLEQGKDRDLSLGALLDYIQAVGGMATLGIMDAESMMHCFPISDKK